MKSENINRWLSLVANIGVVIGLILLIVELNQNSDLVRAQIHQARSDNYVASMIELADTEFLLPAYLKLTGGEGPPDPSVLTSLDPIERERVRRYFQARAADYDNLFFQYSRGYLEEGYYETRIVGSIKRLAPLWIEMDLTGGLTTEFRAEIDRVLADE